MSLFDKNQLPESYLNSGSLHPINQIKDFNISYSLNERTRAFLKIQDGCDYKCSYCTIPLAIAVLEASA